MKNENIGQRGSNYEYSISIGTFKPVSLAWHATATSQGRQIGVRLEFNGPQIAWDNVWLENE